MSTNLSLLSSSKSTRSTTASAPLIMSRNMASYLCCLVLCSHLDGFIVTLHISHMNSCSVRCYQTDCVSFRAEFPFNILFIDFHFLNKQHNKGATLPPHQRGTIRKEKQRRRSYRLLYDLHSIQHQLQNRCLHSEIYINTYTHAKHTERYEEAYIHTCKRFRPSSINKT